jgi:hypothetical protein
VRADHRGRTGDRWDHGSTYEVTGPSSTPVWLNVVETLAALGGRERNPVRDAAGRSSRIDGDGRRPDWLRVGTVGRSSRAPLGIIVLVTR